MDKIKGKKVLFSILIVFLLIVGVSLYINWATTPLPEDKRNISNTDVKMLIDIPDVADRTPIIRTYTKEEFDNFNEKEREKIRDMVSGSIEGDVPALKIENGTGILKISFEKIEKNGEERKAVKAIPDDVPKIKISALETLYSREEPKEINDSLIESEEGIYLYEVKRYLNQDRIYHDKDDEFFMEGIFIEVNYEINREKYVSFFAINTLEYKDEEISLK